MHPHFREVIESLDPKFEHLINMAPIKYGNLPKGLPKRAIYLFSEGDQHLYVGRTNKLRERLRGHCIPSSTHFSATFAFRIARGVTGFTKPTYVAEGSRAALVGHATFGPAFIEAKKRIANMDIRFVEEEEPVRQTLLEVYVAVALRTPYNDFENH